MTAVDTSREAVEQLARTLDDVRNSSAWNRDATATLRALLDERDRLRDALEDAADTLFDAGLNDAWASARAALGEGGE